MTNVKRDGTNGITLLPCPCCGSEHVQTCREFWGGAAPAGSEFSDEVMCDDCGLVAPSIEAWNTRAERMCKPLGTIRYDYEGGYAGFEYETELSCGHMWRDSYGDYPDYCPNCGAKVVDA